MLHSSNFPVFHENFSHLFRFSYHPSIKLRFSQLLVAFICVQCMENKPYLGFSVKSTLTQCLRKIMATVTLTAPDPFHQDVKGIPGHLYGHKGVKVFRRIFHQKSIHFDVKRNSCPDLSKHCVFCLN